MDQDQGQYWPKGSSFRQFIFKPGKGNSQVWNPCKFLQESNVTYLKEGGMYSGGRTSGRGWPDMATSIRCIARINSSAVSFPSWSMSERFLIQKIYAIQFRKMHASSCSPVIWNPTSWLCSYANSPHSWNCLWHPTNANHAHDDPFSPWRHLKYIVLKFL